MCECGKNFVLEGLEYGGRRYAVSNEHDAGIVLKVLICIIIFFIGITVFSFLNVVSERMTKERSEKIYEGRSKCPHCGHSFKISESIPIFHGCIIGENVHTALKKFLCGELW